MLIVTCENRTWRCEDATAGKLPGFDLVGGVYIPGVDGGRPGEDAGSARTRRQAQALRSRRHR